MTAYYDDGTVAIHHGDCLTMPELFRHATVLITDPPYGIAWAKGLNRKAKSRAHAGIANDHDTSTRDAALELWGDRPAVVFGSLYAPPPANVRHVLIWHKPNDAGLVGSTIGYRRDVEAIYLTGPWPARDGTASSVLRSSIPNVGSPSSPAGRTGHPHAKPVDLMRALILAAPPGLILDPFCGSGATLRAAKDLGRPAVGIELDLDYCRTAAHQCGQGVLTLWPTPPTTPPRPTPTPPGPPRCSVASCSPCSDWPPPPSALPPSCS